MKIYEFHPGASEAISNGGLLLLGKLKETELINNPSTSFPSELPVKATITDKEIIGDIIISEHNLSGQFTAKYFNVAGKNIGLKDESYQDLRRLVDQALKTQWVREKLGAAFVEDKIFIWCKDYFTKKTASQLSDFLSSCAQEVVKTFTVWVPVAFLQVEDKLEFGSVKICPITAKMLDDQEKKWIEMRPNQSEAAKMLSDKIRKKMQGLAAIVMDIEAEKGYASDRGLEIAETVVSLIRLHSPAAYMASIVSSCAILGTELAPTSTALNYGEKDSFSYNEAVLPPMPRNWQISVAAWRQVREHDLQYLTDFINDFGLSEFQSSLRLSILTYSKGLSLREPNDRLVYTLSALESLLLRDSSEPIQQNLGERMAFSLKNDADGRQDIVKNVRNIYSMRSSYIHHRVSVTEEIELEKFVISTRNFLGFAIASSRQFQTKREFIEAIDRRKFGG